MIDDISRDIDRALGHVRASWTDERAHQAQRRVNQRLRRRARLRLAAGGAATLGIGLFVSGLVLRGPGAPSRSPSAEVVFLSGSELRLVDGSHGVGTRPESRLEVSELT